MAVQECRQVIIDAIVELLKQIGAEDSQYVTLNNMLIMHQRTMDGMMRTVLCDRVSYYVDRENKYHLIASGGDYCIQLSSELSLDNLQMLYGEVRKVVREH